MSKILLPPLTEQQSRESKNVAKTIEATKEKGKNAVNYVE